jgi:hypothetical protein
MTSRFHKALAKVEKEMTELDAAYYKLKTELDEADKPAILAYQVYTTAQDEDRKLAWKAYEKMREPVVEIGKKMNENGSKRSKLRVDLALRQRQLADFLERKKGYDAAKARKAEREAQSNCIQIGIMKIYVPR